MTSILERKAKRTRVRTERALARFTGLPLAVVASLSALSAGYASPALASTVQPFACGDAKATVITDKTFPQDGYGSGQEQYVLAKSDGNSKCGYIVNDWEQDRNRNTILHGEVLLMLSGDEAAAKESVTVRFTLEPNPGRNQYVTVEKSLKDFSVHKPQGPSMQCRIDAAKVYSGEGLKNLRKLAIIVKGNSPIKIGYITINTEGGNWQQPDHLKLETGGCLLIDE